MSRKDATQTTIDILARLFREEGYSVHTSSRMNNKVFRMLDMLWTTMLNSRKTDVVLIDTYSTANFWYAVLIGALCQILNKPYIPILHGGNLPSRIKNSPKASKFLFKKAMVNIAPSHFLLSEFKKVGFTNLSFIPNTLEITKYSFLDRKAVTPKLLWVRSFSSIYNPIMALQVLEALLKEYPKASLTMVGPAKDESYDECVAFAKAQKLTVTFTGLLAKEEWVALASLHDIFISTTNFDNTPVSVIEAMALGLPIVSTDVGGMPFLIDHNKDGILTPAREVAPFVASLKNILQSPELAQSLAQNARKKAESFDWNTVKKSWEEVLS